MIYGLAKLAFEKKALNAGKARAMAKEVGLFPEGNWKWALRQLRNGRGNLLEGKELADAKTQLGAMDNNSYQQLKKMEREQAMGTRIGQPQDGTEIGGVLDEQGRISKKYVGKKGDGGVTHRNVDFFGNKRMFHTHPDGGTVAGEVRATRQLERANNAIQQQSEKYDQSGLSINTNSLYPSVNYNDAKGRAAGLLAINNLERQIALENLDRKGVRNPLLVDLSGRRSTALLKRTGGDKNKLKQVLKETDQKINQHNQVLQTIKDYVRQGGRDWGYVDQRMEEKGPSMREALRLERERNEFQDPRMYRSGDYAVEHGRTQYRKGDVLHNILSPSQDMEGVHKLHPDGRVRSVYFDRTPAKARKQDADAMREKIDAFYREQEPVEIPLTHQYKPSSKEPKGNESVPQPSPQKTGFSKKVGYGALGTAGLVAGGVGVHQWFQKPNRKVN